ncbi:uncharacterized protein LOC124280268 [Haliotis rubra]|uniref:uncharacterized protein LOC124280268 n=1 Tax=Haliotis rubra TaxID=36100 RepID=UPI001EE52227|nr:uncharacterized protein LOC124280268 [Haliotis rubra]
MEEKDNDTHCRQLRKDLLFLFGNIEENILSDVLSELMKLGVTSVDDLQWVEEEDFKGTIKPVLVRKLLRGYKAKLAPSGSSSVSLSSLSSPSLSPVSFSPKTPPPITVQNINRDPNWPLKLEIPWDNMGRDVCRALQEGKRLSPTAKKELVNKTVDAVRKTTERASKHQLGIIAQRMVAKFPDSLEDRIDGTVFWFWISDSA